MKFNYIFILLNITIFFLDFSFSKSCNLIFARKLFIFSYNMIKNNLTEEYTHAYVYFC